MPHSSSQSPAASRFESGLKLDVEEGPTAEISGDDDDGWVSPQNSTVESRDDATESPVVGEGPAAWVASVSRLVWHLYTFLGWLLISTQKIIPLLPPPESPPRPFSIKRARLTANRLFLALEPTYYPILKSFWDLATWKNYGTSLLFCTVNSHPFLLFCFLIFDTDILAVMVQWPLTLWPLSPTPLRPVA